MKSMYSFESKAFPGCYIGFYRDASIVKPKVNLFLIYISYIYILLLEGRGGEGMSGERAVGCSKWGGVVRKGSTEGKLMGNYLLLIFFFCFFS